MSLEPIDPKDESLLADCRRYVRGLYDDESRWDAILDRCGTIVAAAWLRYEDGEWLDADGAERPTLLDVEDDALCTDWLVFADDEEKEELEAEVERLLTEYPTEEARREYFSALGGETE